MDKKSIHTEGTTKSVYNTQSENQIILEFKDSDTKFDGEKKAKFKNKGVLKNTISHILFEYLEGYNIPTHYKEKINDRQMLVKKLKMLPIYVIIRNVAAGSLCERFKIKKGSALKYPVIEYYLKDEKLNNPMILDSHAYAFEYATPEEMKFISRISSKINAVLKSFLERRKIKLVDYKLEFGRFKNTLYLADEITPDTCRLWDVSNGEPDDKYFNLENNNAEKSYIEICERIAGG
ncbi:MAG: phosphoribosylaminoimidazolesuccinocarboxamide synthase [Calditrichaceae bacterium]